MTGQENTWCLKLKLLLALLAASAAFPATVSSQPKGVFQFGGQVCKPMNLNIGQKGYQWRSEGAINRSDQSMWTVCSVPSSGFPSFGDMIATVFNNNDYDVDMTCLVKITDVGTLATVSVINHTQYLFAGTTGFVGAEGMFLDMGQSASISCNLPPGTGVSSILSEVY